MEHARNVEENKTHIVPTPSPRLSGERAGARGFDPEKTGSSPPALSSFGEEREKNAGSGQSEAA
jgi:hypothetical protein